MKHVLTEIATCILWLLTTICLVAMLFMVAPSYAHEEQAADIVALEDLVQTELVERKCEFLSVMKGIAVIQQDTSFQTCLMVLERPEVFTEERRNELCDNNKTRAAFTDTVTQLMHEAGC